MTKLWHTVRAALGPDELALALALGLIMIGLWPVWRPGVALAPGLVLLWIVLPPRRRFFVEPNTKDR